MAAYVPLSYVGHAAVVCVPLVGRNTVASHKHMTRLKDQAKEKYLLHSVQQSLFEYSTTLVNLNQFLTPGLSQFDQFCTPGLAQFTTQQSV